MKKRRLLFFAVAFFAAAALLSAQGSDPYKVFNNYRAAAMKELPYPGAPLKGKVVGFANALAVLPFCALLEKGLENQVRLAGGDLEKGWISLDNKYNPAVALKNVEVILSRHPDLFIEYQLDVKTNNMIAEKLREAKIPILAVDVDIPGAPIAGTNNYTVATIAGHAMARLIREKWGGWDNVDLVVIMGMPGREHLMLRAEGVADALAEEFGIDPKNDPKILRSQGGIGDLAQAKAAMTSVLAAHPDAVRIAMTSVNEQTMAGFIAAMQEAGRWEPETKVVVTIGVDQLGQSLIREGLSDAGVAFFPEHYAEYIVPAVAAMLTGNAVPPGIFVQNEVITKANIDTWYPKQ
jgi:ABC-type sugar transport system substrate-binding protein